MEFLQTSACGTIKLSWLLSLVVIRRTRTVPQLLSSHFSSQGWRYCTSTDDVWVTLIESQTAAWRFPAHRSVSQWCFLPMTTTSACSHVSGLLVTDVPGDVVTAYTQKGAQALRAQRKGLILKNKNLCFEFGIRWNHSISVNPQIVPPSFKVT